MERLIEAIISDAGVALLISLLGNFGFGLYIWRKEKEDREERKARIEADKDLASALQVQNVLLERFLD